MDLTDKTWIPALLIGLIICILVSPSSAIDNNPETTFSEQLSYSAEQNGVIIGPGHPPANWSFNSNPPKYSEFYAGTGGIITDVPVLLWSYGCSVTAASMLFGYYDRHGYPNMYAGPTNSGDFPLTSVWGHQTIETDDSNGENPLGASHQGIDGRITKGHVDDYYYSSMTSIDPYNYTTHWNPHTDDSLGDYMGTSQYWKWGAPDGATWFYLPSDNSPAYDITQFEYYPRRDGARGMKLFAISRGYTVISNFNQYIAGYNGNSAGFTYTQYKTEIDNDHPVLIHLRTGTLGHTMLGVGYSGTNQILVHDTWDSNQHTMTWGGSYGGMTQEAVTVFHLAPNDGDPSPTVTSITPAFGANTGSVSITNLAGTNFANGAIVRLTRSGSANITASGVTVVSPSRITCTLPLSGTTEGQYNVVVRNLDGKEGVLSNGFTIAPEPTPGGDGITIFRPSTGYWYFDYDLNGIVDNSFRYGSSTDQIIAGDWQGTGTNGIAIFRPSTGYWYFDYNLDGTVDKSFRFGSSTDRISKGDWNNDQKDDIAIFRPSTGYWYFDYNLDGVIDNSFRFGSSTDRTIVGKFIMNSVGIEHLPVPIVAASGEKIAFMSNREGNYDIYVMNTDGTGQTRLTTNAADDRAPSWSPDCSKIAFESIRSGNNDIYVMNTDGTGQTRLTTNTADDIYASWSPDGKKIAFSSNQSGYYNIYVMNADGTGQTRLTSTTNGLDLAPSWSPDGSRITFTAYRRGTYNYNIYVMNADGTGQTILTTITADDLWPSWSPDGTKIVFCSEREGDSEVYIMNQDGTQQTQLTFNKGFDYSSTSSWSPDGKKIAYYSTRNGNYDIYVMNPDGTGQTPLTSNTAWDIKPAWSHSQGGNNPTVTSITPAFGANTGSVSITNLAGTNFASGAIVRLTRSGFTNITATGVTVVSPTRITCTLPLTGTTEGQYNVVVRNLDGKEGVFTNGFTIGPEPPEGGDGIAIFRPSTGYWYFDYNLNGAVDNSFRFGSSTDQIITGDWQGTGTNGIAIFRSSTGYWYFDYNLDGTVDKSFRFGSSTDRISKGDWNNDQKDDIAIFRPSTGYWYFDYNLDGTVDKSFRYGSSMDRILSGKWV